LYRVCWTAEVDGEHGLSWGVPFFEPLRGGTTEAESATTVGKFDDLPNISNFGNGAWCKDFVTAGKLCNFEQTAHEIDW
jgi:hypothetical protein